MAQVNMVNRTAGSLTADDIGKKVEIAVKVGVVTTMIEDTLLTVVHGKMKFPNRQWAELGTQLFFVAPGIYHDEGILVSTHQRLEISTVKERER